MLANAIDEPSVLSRSVEACSSFSKTNQGRREEEEKRKRGRKHQWTVMESREEGKMQAQQTDSDHCPWFGNTKLKKKTKGMREGETVNSRIDPTRVGQIKPLQPVSHALEWMGLM